MCFFCEELCVIDKKHPSRNLVQEVTTLPFRDKLLQLCRDRNDDTWGLQVKSLLLNCYDLVAAEGRYHKNCYDKFRKMQPEQQPTIVKSPGGRNVDQTKVAQFEELYEWMESEGELYSLYELQQKLKEIASSSDVYEIKSIKKKLQERYGSHIYISEVDGRKNVVCFKNSVAYLVNDRWFANREEKAEDESERIITLAAKLILADIRSTNFDCSCYPLNETIENVEKGKEWLPKLLRVFVEKLIKNPLCQVSVGQCIVNVTRTKSSLPPIPFGLGVEMDNVFGSKWLINELNSLGFSVSSDEVLRYKQSVTDHEETSDVLRTYFPGSFTQWMADNADHNGMTIDGKGVMHAMGSCCATTSSENGSCNNLLQIKRQKRKPVNTITRNKGIPVIPYIYPVESGLSRLFLKPILQLQMPYILSPDIQFDLVWHAQHFSSKELRPNWSGFMSNVSVGDYPGKAIVSFLPILDMNPSDLTCIYSVLLFIVEQAKYLDIHSPVITFDQPLWLKATEVINAKNLQVVLILGGFHLMMSFLGSMGSVMKGSGLSEATETIYGVNAVQHIMSGKAVSRALRSHMLIYSALTTKIISKFLPAYINENIPDDEGQSIIEDKEVGSVETEAQNYAEDNEEINENEEIELIASNEDSDEWKKLLEELNLKDIDPKKLKNLVDSIMNDKNNALDIITESKELTALNDNIQMIKDKLCTVSRTAKYCVQHLSYINILKLFIRAERTGNWNLHLVCLSKMINLFAASGHINYAKCARLHLQNMLELPTKYPWVHTKFSQHGYHTVRRTNTLGWPLV